jgi:hypothetical protein
METLTHDDYVASVRALISTLRILGVSVATVEFSGSGDSGSINDIYVDIGLSLKEHEIEFVNPRDVYTPSGYKKQYTRESISLYDALVTFTYDQLSDTGLDWYNNDGGQGTLEIDLSADPPAIRLGVEINVIHTEDHIYDLGENFGLVPQENN